MSASDDSPGLSRAERRVQDALDHLHQQRAEFRRALQLQQITQRMHLQFQQAALDVYDELRPYRDEVEDEWTDALTHEQGLDALPRLAGQTRTETATSMHGGRPVQETTTEPVPVPPVRLLEISYELDDIARELGFGSEIEQTTPHDEPTKENLRELLTTREQDDALDSAPPGEE